MVNGENLSPVEELLRLPDPDSDYPNEPSASVDCKRCENGEAYPTDLVCRNCSRSPSRVHPAYWVIFAVLIFVGLTFQDYPMAVSGIDGRTIVFVFSLLGTGVYFGKFGFSSEKIQSGRLIALPSIFVLGAVIFANITDVADSTPIFIISGGLLIAIVGIPSYISASSQLGNGLKGWLQSALIVVPVDVWLVATVSSVIVDIVDGAEAGITTSVGHVLALAPGVVRETIYFIYGAGEAWLNTSLGVRLLLLAGYILIVVSVVGVMGAIKKGVSGGLLRFWSEKVRLAVVYSGKAVLPLARVWWRVNRSVLFSVGSVLGYFAVLLGLYRLTHWPYSGVTVGSVAELALIIVGGLWLVVPITVHLAAKYELTRSEFHELTFKNYGRAHFNLLLWASFVSGIGSLIVSGFNIDHAKIAFVAFTVGGLSVFGARRIRQKIAPS